jgi:hypothetical membrane protein
MYNSDRSEFRKESGLNDDFDTPGAAGVLYSSAAFVLLMGIITAETKYPVSRHYTTRQEISDLGGTRPPHGLVTQPSAMIFDATMLIAGVLLLAGAFALWRLYRNRVLTVVSTLFGAGALLVGIFPGNTAPHPYVAMIAFVFSALTAIAAFRVTSAPFRFMSLAVGVLSLAALIVGELGRNSPVVKSIGIGGAERWVVFPIILWLAFYGGYLLASGHRMPPDRHRPATVDGSTGAQAEPPAVVPAP